MRGLLTATLVAAAIGFGTAPLAAAPASTTAPQNATPLTQLAQGGYYYSGGYRRSCPYGYRYTCWYDYYGYRHCGCRPY
jgi:hypothetical protein